MTAQTGGRWREFSAIAMFALRAGVEALSHNALRAGLTSLGILFGVASVIAMLAIGRGAEQEILEQMRLLGSNNIIVKPIVEQKEESAQAAGEKQTRKWTPGLTARDGESVQRIIPEVEHTSGEIVLNTLITREGRRRSGKLVGVDTAYFSLLNLDLASGHLFTPSQIAGARPVAIIGAGVKARFFTTEDPIGRTIKVGENWLTVVGVLADRASGPDQYLAMPFLGSPARFPTGPFRMAVMLRRPVYFMAGIYLGGNRYQVHFERLDPPAAANREDTVAALLACYVAALERHCRLYPYNWFNFFNFWNTD